MADQIEKVPRTPAGWMIGSEYVAVKARKCPHCGSGDVVHGKPVMRGPHVAMPSDCGSCKNVWLTLYGLIGYDPIRGAEVSDGAQAPEGAV